MSKLIINTEYKELVRFLFSELREERTFPVRDNFFLVKNLSGKEHILLERFNNYMIISQNYFSEAWDRQEIFNYVAFKINSKRKPKFDLMPKEEFERNIKVFLISKIWMTEDEESNMFELYKNIDTVYRYQNYFTLRGLVQSHVAFYSLLTFINKALTVNSESIVGKGYYRVLLSKKRRIKENFKTAIDAYISHGKTIDNDFKVLRFLMDIGG